MSIKLDFPNPHSAKASAVNIYRSNTRMSVESLPAILVTLPGNAVTYTDTAAALNTTYFYRVEVVVGDEVVLSSNVPAGNFPNVGPGPKTLKMGDWNLGYFGIVPPADLLNFSEMATQLGITANVAADSTNLGWHKFIRNGKILFMGSTPFLLSMTWQNVYNLGLIYGVDGSGELPSAAASSIPAVNQKRTVTKNADTFLVKAPKINLLSTSVPVADQQTFLDGVDGSEWADLMLRIGVQSNRNSVKGKWYDLPATGVYVWTQHFQNTGSSLVILRSAAEDFANATRSNTYGYLPILEMI